MTTLTNITGKDFADLNLEKNNPAAGLDQNKLTTLTILTNTLILNTDLNPYPNLKSRFDNGAITNEEFGAFVISRSWNLDEIWEIYSNDFPVDIDIRVISNLVQAVDSQIEQTIVQLHQPAQPGIPVTVVNNEQSVVTNQIPQADLGTPVTQFIPATGPNANGQYTPGAQILAILTSLDKFYEEEMGTALENTDLCALLQNPFAKLSSLISTTSQFTNQIKSLVEDGNLKEKINLTGNTAASKIAGLVQDITDFSVANLVNDAFSKLQNIEQEVLNLVDKLKEDMLSKVKNIQNEAMELVNTINSSGRRLFEHINRKVSEAKEFFNDFNMETMKTKIKSVMTMNFDQFEENLPATLNGIAMKACQLSSMVSSFMNGPVDSLKGFMGNIKSTLDISQNFSNIQGQMAQAVGGIRVSIDQRNTRRNQVFSNFNSTQSSQRSSRSNPGSVSDINAGSYVTLEMSSDERTLISNLTAEGNDNFIFAGSVKNMGLTATQQYNNTKRGSEHWDPKENAPDAGWKIVAERNPVIFAGLARVAKKLTETDGVITSPLTLNSCFRSRWYNRVYLRQIQGNTGAAWNSVHMAAMAVDISTGNMSDQGVSLLIRRLSEEGFSRISVYNSFVHADIKDQGNYRGNWTNNYRGNAAIRKAMEIHLRDGFRNG